MIYSNNMIAWQHHSNVNSDTKDTRSRRRSRLLTLSAQHRRIINPGQFLTSGPPAERRGDICAVPLQGLPLLTASLPLQRKIPEAGFQWVIWQQYDRSVKKFVCK